MVFDDEALGEENVKKPHRERLLNILQNKFHHFKELKKAETTAHIDKLLAQAAADLIQVILS